MLDSLRRDELAGRQLAVHVEPDANTRMITAATAEKVRQARDSARALLLFASFSQFLRWGVPDEAPLDAIADTYRRYGLGLFLHVGLAFVEPGNLIPRHNADA